MKVDFYIDSALGEDEIEISVKSGTRTAAVDELLVYIKKYATHAYTLLPIKTADRIFTIKIKDLIKIEVQGNILTYYTKQEVIKATGRLYQVLEKLTPNFSQISRHCVINLNYLDALEASFAGNMVAMMQNNLKANISRRYLADLEKKLGL